MTGAWVDFSLDRPRDQTACRSWFGFLLKEEDSLLVVQGFEKDNGDMKKLRALVRRADGTLRQMVRSNLARSVKLTVTTPDAALIARAKMKGALS